MLALVAGLLAGALCLPAFAQPVASAVRVETEGPVTRLIFETSARVEAEAYVMSNPDRVIIDLPEVNFQLPPKAGQPEPVARGKKVPAKVVSSFRFGQFAAGKARVVVDLGRPAVVKATHAVPRIGGFDLIIEMQEADPAAFAQAVKQATQEAVAREILADVPKRGDQKGSAGLPVIVIDPGHGGIDVGAQASGNVQEKDIVFDFAKTLRTQLEKTGRYRVVMTRSGDVFVPLGERVKTARDANADLFISIHADILSDPQGVSGATVYTVSDKASDREAARLAEKENLADSVAGLEGKEDAGDVSDILFDLTRRETRTWSHAFARTLVNYWGEAGPLNKNPHRSAGFRVLKAPDVPSVLLELGYLSNARDTAALTRPEWRGRAAEAMVKAVDAFFANRTGTAATGKAGAGR
jgi:N-acetylmuramoyl-L-alanine amidase